ncbi:late embryogenesis abundant protein At1g64065-like [Mercurialis annua]|uniref:late embryogenesis abundant protein At1g64065-like n=1 Tax=Mercurialis annua TaxID=3986 RepID=UPI00215F4510|nr:late embryogenesis abundant protein At1g64065-like [Mercurialis annua]
MAEQDQARPLAPSADRTSSDDEEAAIHLKKIRRRRCIKCCGCITVTLLIQAIAIVTLIFTVFKVKDPTIRLNNVIITHMELVNNTIPKPGTNISLIADVSVKNPNVASFKYDNTTSTLYYRGIIVGEARGPPGHSKARRTMRMNATVDLVTDKLISNPNLASDAGSGLLTIDAFTKLPGRVKIWFVKKHVTVKMNCSMTVNITSQAIHSQKCKNDVDL